jgi:hypothetical protein
MVVCGAYRQCGLEVKISTARLLLTDSACCAEPPRAGKK